jgi:hypothetical protein
MTEREKWLTHQQAIEMIKEWAKCDDEEAELLLQEAMEYGIETKWVWEQ